MRRPQQYNIVLQRDPVVGNGIGQCRHVGNGPAPILHLVRRQVGNLAGILSQAQHHEGAPNVVSHFAGPSNDFRINVNVGNHGPGEGQVTKVLAIRVGGFVFRHVHHCCLSLGNQKGFRHGSILFITGLGNAGVKAIAGSTSHHSQLQGLRHSVGIFSRQYTIERFVNDSITSHEHQTLVGRNVTLRFVFVLLFHELRGMIGVRRDANVHVDTGLFQHGSHRGFANLGAILFGARAGIDHNQVPWRRWIVVVAIASVVGSDQSLQRGQQLIGRRQIFGGRQAKGAMTGLTAPPCVFGWTLVVGIDARGRRRRRTAQPRHPR
mmetsp:Transcript_16686/g.45864  ORF Transcript_16686/g.45864 Transcript_16686/m.45864 type:complete len:321 (+) Transcript_16686:785-1747(+)